MKKNILLQLFKKGTDTYFFRKLGICPLFLVLTFGLSSCAFFSKSVDGSRPAPAQITKHEAIRVAKDFASEQGFGDEFRLNKASKINKELTTGENPYWVWQVYFPHKSQTLKKFYQKSPIMIEVNATTGSVENWGRR